MSAEKQECRGEPVKVVAIDLYERLLTERASDSSAFDRKYSPVMRAAVEGYERARALAVAAARKR